MVVDIINEILESLPMENGGEIYPIFMHGEKEIQNALSDEIDLESRGAIVYLDEPINYNLLINQGGYKEKVYIISMLFAGKSEIDWSPAQHRTVINNMVSLSDRFINKLEQHESIRSVQPQTPTGTEIKNIFNVNLSGVMIRLNVIPYNSISAC